MVDDRTIIELLKENNQNGLELAIKKYSGLVFMISKNVLFNFPVQDIEECVSDTFLSLWQTFDRYAPTICTLKTWIITIARRRAVDKFRRNRSQKGETPVDGDIPSTDMTPEEYVIVVEDLNELYAAINALSKSEKELFYRRYYLFQSCIYIGEELDMKPETIRKQLWKIRQKLIAETRGI